MQSDIKNVNGMTEEQEIKYNLLIALSPLALRAQMSIIDQLQSETIDFMLRYTSICLMSFP